MTRTELVIVFVKPVKSTSLYAPDNVTESVALVPITIPDVPLVYTLYALDSANVMPVNTLVPTPPVYVLLMYGVPVEVIVPTKFKTVVLLPVISILEVP